MQKKGTVKSYWICLTKFPAGVVPSKADIMDSWDLKQTLKQPFIVKL